LSSGRDDPLHRIAVENRTLAIHRLPERALERACAEAVLTEILRIRQQRRDEGAPLALANVAAEPVRPSHTLARGKSRRDCRAGRMQLRDLRGPGLGGGRPRGLPVAYELLTFRAGVDMRGEPGLER